ncbi:MAG: lipid-A-disaccharide synthase [Cyclobacteriaceae bacterium]|nr:lipid-A-disaccharide synthase [Cyclobacteriaceae bacterium]
MKYFLIAGEKSGDLHASNLVKALKEEDPNAIFCGMGGDDMQRSGVRLIAHYRELSVMGLFEVLRSLPKIRKFLKICQQEILIFNPEVVILVDYAGFNLRIARFARKKGFRVYYYITPKVWAWNRSRVKTIRAYVDKAFVILPFEKDFFDKYQVESEYVGNPVLDAINKFTPREKFLEENNLKKEDIRIALLPGSRRQEVIKMLPVFMEIAQIKPDWQFLVAGVTNLEVELYNTCLSRPNVHLIYDDNYNILHHSHAAIVTSGTATLETALLKVPQAVVYKTGSSVTYYLVRWIIKVPFISLPNLIINREIIKELIQDQSNAQRILAEIERILKDDAYRYQMLEGYDTILKLLGSDSASKKAARSIYNNLTASY